MAKTEKEKGATLEVEHLYDVWNVDKMSDRQLELFRLILDEEYVARQVKVKSRKLQSSKIVPR